jgi:hypothetical protein
MKKAYPYLFYFFFALLFMFPFLGDGFLLLLDLPWSPRLDIGDALRSGVSASLPLFSVLAFLSKFSSSALVEKLLLGSIFFLAGLSMYRFVRSRSLPDRWSLLSGLFYMFNPWTYERFLAGHYQVLLGYALFPLFVQHLWSLQKGYERRNFQILLLLAVVYPLLSLHWAYIAYGFAILTGLFYIWQKRGLAAFSTLFFWKKFSLVALLTLAVNSFWLFSFWGTASVWPKIGVNDFYAFATQADPLWGATFNVLSLYGYWQEIFFLPKDYLPYWWLVSFTILGLALLALIQRLRQKDAWAHFSILVFPLVLIVALGVATPISEGLTLFFYNYLPGFRGLRETAKLGGVLAFFLAFYFPLGLYELSRITCQGAKERYCWSMPILASGVVLVYLSSYGMLSAFSAQLRPSNYPPGWEKVETIMNSDPSAEKALFLPWTAYPVLDFAGHKRIANPAQGFFTIPIVAGKNLDSVYLKESDQGDWDNIMIDLVHGVIPFEVGLDFFRSQDISHIILAKTDNAEAYSWLEAGPGLKLVYEDEAISLFHLE